VNANDITVPALRKGKGLLGPEYAGCCNSGTRPLIMRSKVLDGDFWVGPELYVSDARHVAIREFYRLNGKRRRVYRIGKRRRVYRFKSRAPAVAKFRELCAEVLRFNDGIRREREQAAECSRRGDVVGAAGHLLNAQ